MEKPYPSLMVESRNLSNGISQAHLDAFGQLVSRLPGRVAFFAKDLQGRLIAGNQSLCQRIGAENIEQVLGRDDSEFFTKAMVAQFRKDDEQVFRTGNAREGIIESFFSTTGLPDWCVTDKIPLLDEDGSVVGLIGTSRHLDTDDDAPLSAPGLSKAISFLRENFSSPILVEDIVEASGVSRRTLERLFATHVGLSPSFFLTRTRILSSCELLRTTTESISEIALDLNFCDQSAFTKHFKDQMGLTPSAYRAAGG